MKPKGRQGLRDAAESLDENCAQRADETTHAAWRALLEGRCSLVESFDSRGRRFLVARCNPPEITAPSALSSVEARALALRARSASYKVIADELGLSTAAGHNLVQSGMKKLGIHDEAELPPLFGRTLRRKPPPER